jgi:hypothetical protein|nr:MAG TPA: minor capsid protein [Caudoviricetes sp.]
MGRPRLPNNKKAYKGLSRRLAGYMLQVRNIYDRLNEKVATLVESVGYDGSTEFFFSDFPEVKRDLLLLQRQFVGEMQTLIYSGTSVEWKNSNIFQDAVANKALKYYRAQVSGERFKHYFDSNSDQLKAFQARKDKGLNLSTKLWKQADIYKESLEATISTAIEKGMSATTLSKRISRYLKDWPSLQADYQERYAKATRCHDCEYNSIRLARNEISMAYRTAEQLRWQKFDFILGYKIKLSDSHPRYDICDELMGDYPKDFSFAGWHPNCLCYTVPIVMSEEEYWSDNREDSPNKITDPPENFSKWVYDNSKKIQEAETRGTLPYWIKDNKMLVSQSIKVGYGDLSLNEINDKIKKSPTIITQDVFSRNGIYNDSRRKLHDDIVKTYLGDAKVKSDYVYMLGGAPANGKSTLVDSGLLPHPKGALVIDPDKVKSMIPEYQKMITSGDKTLIAAAANFVHEESSLLGKRIQKEAFNRGVATIVDGVNDGSFEKVAEKVSKIREMSGKRIRADYVSLDTNLSLKLARLRAEKTGRVVPESYIRSCNSEISKIIPKAVKNGVFDELYLWDTNINGSPRLILKMVDGELSIESRKLYESFLNKAKK